MGRRNGESQQGLWIATSRIARAPGHPFYRELNRRLAAAGFDPWVEELCAPYYADGMGRPGIPPGVYFRMLMVGYFEGIDSQRGIAWRCADSLSLRQFLGYKISEQTPEHSSLSRIRERLPLQVHQEVFHFVLRLLAEEDLLRGETVGVDASTLEANAAMKSIVRRETGEGWGEYVGRLMEEDPEVETGPEGPTEAEMRRYDRSRGSKKKVSNEEWESPADPDARITKMKDGRTRLGYKAEHVVDLDTEAVLAAEVKPADEGDAAGLAERIEQAEGNAAEALHQEQQEGEDRTLKEAVADKGYHKAEALAECAGAGVRTYVPERRGGQRRRWTDKPLGWEKAYRGNRRRVRGNRGKALQRRRSEVVERSFAHVCETGGARRTWIRGILEVRKRYLIQVAAHNLSILMRKVCGAGKPKALAGAVLAISSAVAALGRASRRLLGRVLSALRPSARRDALLAVSIPGTAETVSPVQNPTSSTGCY
ncbi:MAG: transposase [Candidatus Brocadiaceae bacterium]